MSIKRIILFIICTVITQSAVKAESHRTTFLSGGDWLIMQAAIPEIMSFVKRFNVKSFDLSEYDVVLMDKGDVYAVFLLSKERKPGMLGGMPGKWEINVELAKGDLKILNVYLPK